MAFLANILVPLALVAVDGIQTIQLQKQAEDIELLRAELATLRLNIQTHNDATTTPWAINPTASTTIPTPKR